MFGKSKKSNDRDWLAFVLALIFFILVLLSVSFYHYMETSETIISDVDKRLSIGVVSIKSLLAKDFHDRATDIDSISPEEDDQNIRLLSEFANKIHFKFLYTLIKSDDKIYITSSSATKEELAQNEQVRYFNPFDEADSNFYIAFDSNTPTSFTHKDRWGTFRALAIPEKSPNGKKYLSVAEFDISYINNILGSKLVETFMSAALLLFGAFPLLYAVFKRMKKQSEDQQRMEKKLQQAQKMESVGRLAGGVAHDFNNILSVIIGYSELSLEVVDKNDPLYNHLNEILIAAKRSTDITRQLLTFASKQTIAPKVLDINDIVGSMLKMIRRLIGEDIELSWIPGTKIQPIEIDPSQVDQILANLCINSRDAIENVGKITIETKNINFDKDYCDDHAEFIPGDYVMLTVSDDGNGIPPDKKDKIFEPFFTTKSDGKGTGLGLATVYGIVKQNNGFINVYSEPDRGTTIRIYLPQIKGKTSEIEYENVKEIPEGHNETVLIVEDDISILKLGEKILESLGYNVICCATPSDAIQKVTENKGKIDLLLTDVIIPEMNGRELSENIKQVYPDIKVLFMSGYTANIIAHRGVLEDGVNFISKPLSKKDMAVKIREVLSQENI
jgi:signal transduction histidine kinase/CheY-like chemotaxis protein